MRNLGREIIANILRVKTPAMKAFLEAGFNMEWLKDSVDLSRAAVFSETDLEAYTFIVKHYLSEREVPSTGFFRFNYPAETFRLPESDVTTNELVAAASSWRYEVQIRTYGGDFIDLVESGKFEDAQAVTREITKIRVANSTKNIHIVWDGKEYDLDPRINREINQGVLTGIEALDADFTGWQPGDLVTYLGREKAGKTSFFLKSSLATYFNEEVPRKILFVSVEIAAGNDPSRPGIADRLDAFSAGVSFKDYSRGRLSWDHEAMNRLIKARAEMDLPGEYHIIQPVGTYTILDLENDIETYEPDVVYVDGFYMMTDIETGKGGGDWQGHDNLAKAFKFLAMRKKIVLLTSTQVRAKQLSGKKKEIEGHAMMGGTGLNMWSDMVLGVNIDDDKVTHTITCSASRTGYLPTVRGTWDWSTCTFNGAEEVPESEEFEETY
jgi:hypothetical protein